MDKNIINSEKKFQKALEFTPVPIAVADRNGDIVFFNRQFIKTYGYSRQDITSLKMWFDIVYPDKKYRDYVIKDWALATEKALKADLLTDVREYNVTCKNGEVKLVAISAYFEGDYIIGTFIDLTEQRRTENELKESEEKFSKAFDIIPDTLAIIDLETKERVAVNEYFAETVGYSKEILLQNRLGALNEIDMTKVEAAIKAIKKGKSLRDVEVKVKHKNGSERIMLYGADPIKVGNRNCMIVSGKDITDLKIAEENLMAKNLEIAAQNEEYESLNEELRLTNEELYDAQKQAVKSEKKYRNIIENSIITIYSYNIKTRTYDYLSPSVEIMYGYKPDEFIRGGLETTIERFHPEDVKKIENHLKKLLDNKLEDFSPTIKYRFKHPKLGYRWISDTRTVIFDTNNQPVSLIGYSLDITDKIRSEKDLKKQNEEYAALNEEYKTQNEELIKSKEKAEEQELLLRLSTELGNVAVWEYDFMANSMSRSKNHDALYGLDWQDEWDINVFLNATHPEDREYSNNMIQKSVAPGGPDSYSFDFRIIYPDKSTHWLSVIGQVEKRNNDGVGILVRGCLIDITDRKKAEQELNKEKERAEENEKFLRLLLESSENMITLHNKDGSYSYFNGPSIYPVKPEEVVGKNPYDFFTEENAKNLTRNIKAVFDTGKSVSFEAKLNWLGEQKWFSEYIYPVKNRNHDIIAAAKICSDISEKKQAEIELLETKRRAEESETKWISYTENSDDTIILTDNDLKIRYINKVMPTAIPKDVIGRSIFEFVQEEHHDKMKETFEKVIQTKLPDSYETKLNMSLFEDGLDTLYFVTKVVPYLTNKTFSGFILIASDITEKKKAELKLLESEYMWNSLTLNTNDTIQIINTDYEIKYINKLSLGFKQEDIIGTSIFQWVSEEYHDTIKETIKRVVETRTPSRYKTSLNANVLGAEMQRMWFNVNVVPLQENGEVKSMFLIATEITEQENAKEKLIRAKEQAEESEFQLQAMLNSVPDLVFRINASGVFLSYKADEKDLYYQVDTIIGKNYKDILPKYLVALFDEKIEKTLRTGDLQTFVYNLETPKIGEKIYEARISQSGVDEITAIVRDITEQKKTEHELAESTERFKALHNASFGGIAIHDKGLILECNQGLSEMTGYTLEELIGMDGLSLIATKSRDLVMKNIMDGYEKPYEALGIRKNGEIYPIRLEGRNVPYKGKNVRTVELRDITASKQAEEALRRSEAIKNTMVSNIGDVIVIIDENGLNKYKSPNITKMFGWNPEELIGKSTWNNIHPDDLKAGQEFISVIAKEPNATGAAEVRYKCKDGKYVWIEINVINLFHDKDIQGILGNYREITERKYAEQELVAAKEKAEESDRLKSEFIHNMSHEIRTPLNGILGFSKFLNKDSLSPQKRMNYVNIIQNSGNQLMRIIDDILEISKLSTKQVKIINIELCLNDFLFELFSVFDLKAKENKTPLYLRKGLSDFKSTIFTDQSKLNKVLSNLLENAIKFTSEGFVEFGYQLINDNIEIYVKDTGVGIKPEMHDRIFERFSQEEKELSRNFGGLGLGLSIAKENAELLGGEIRLISEKGKGATFFVTIPYKPVFSEDEVSDRNNEHKINEQDECTILIVEDEEVNYLFLETLLNEEFELKSRVLHAKNGKEAVEICKKDLSIQLVLMDLKMPEMNGYEATKLIKEFRANLPIIAQTAYTKNEDREKAILAGCDDFISKPIYEEDLNKIIDKYLITN